MNAKDLKEIKAKQAKRDADMDEYVGIWTRANAIKASLGGNEVIMPAALGHRITGAKRIGGTCAATRRKMDEAALHSKHADMSAVLVAATPDEFAAYRSRTR